MSYATRCDEVRACDSWVCAVLFVESGDCEASRGPTVQHAANQLCVVSDCDAATRYVAESLLFVIAAGVPPTNYAAHRKASTAQIHTVINSLVLTLGSCVWYLTVCADTCVVELVTEAMHTQHVLNMCL
jgi:hypothetical protein